MCIAIYHDAGVCLDANEFRLSWKNNPDGGGFAYINSVGRIVTYKTMSFDKMYEAYYEAQARNSESPFLVHFRIATHGTVNEYNCHPFEVGKDMALIHNGIIPVLISKTDKRSDTRVFVEEYLPRLPFNWQDDEYLFSMVEEFIGSSKVVLLTNRDSADSNMYILNESSGHWNTAKNTWYSNSSYCSVPKNKSLWKPGAPKSYEPVPLAIDHPLDVCTQCMSPSVFDDMCYTCGICQDCNMSDIECMCYNSIGSANYQSPV